MTQCYLHGLVPAKIARETARDILHLAKKELHKPLKTLSVLDVGSGWGNYTFEFEPYVKDVTGVEPYKRACLYALREGKKTDSRAHFFNKKIEHFNSKKRFDLIVSLTTIEHMPDVEASFKRIFLLLKPGGMIYITAPNKLWPYEYHYKLYFLNWLPLPLANIYVRIMGRGRSFEDSSYAKTYFGMKKLLDQFPVTYNFHIPRADAVYIGCGENTKTQNLIKNIGIWLLTHFSTFWILSKGFIIVGRKRTKMD